MSSAVPAAALSSTKTSMPILFARDDVKDNYGAHSIPKPFNKLIHLLNKINQFSVFNKIIS